MGRKANKLAVNERPFVYHRKDLVYAYSGENVMLDDSVDDEKNVEALNQVNKPRPAQKRPEAGWKWDLMYTTTEKPQPETMEKSFERKLSIKQLLKKRFSYSAPLLENGQLKISRKGHDHLLSSSENLDGSGFLGEKISLL